MLYESDLFLLVKVRLKPEKLGITPRVGAPKSTLPRRQAHQNRHPQTQENPISEDIFRRRLKVDGTYLYSQNCLLCFKTSRCSMLHISQII